MSPLLPHSGIRVFTIHYSASLYGVWGLLLLCKAPVRGRAPQAHLPGNLEPRGTSCHWPPPEPREALRPPSSCSCGSRSWKHGVCSTFEPSLTPLLRPPDSSASSYLSCNHSLCPLPTSSEPRTFLFLAHPHRSGLWSLQLGAPPARQPPCQPLRVCPVTESAPAPPTAFSGGVPTQMQSRAGAVQRSNEEGVGTCQRDGPCCPAVQVPARLPSGTMCWTSSQESGASSQAAAHHW